MKIGLDYSGVISFDPDGWAKILTISKSRGHQVYLISHALVGADLQLRHDFADKVGIIDLSFSDLQLNSQNDEIAKRKADLCQEHGIELFIDDDLHKAEAVGRMCNHCAVLYIPQSLWQIGQRLIEGLNQDG